jgi:hypothetical protein
MYYTIIKSETQGGAGGDQRPFMGAEKGKAGFTSELLKCLGRHSNMPEMQFMIIQHSQMIMD